MAGHYPRATRARLEHECNGPGGRTNPFDGTWSGATGPAGRTKPFDRTWWGTTRVRHETKPFDRTWWGTTRVRHERDLNVNGIGPLVEPSLLIGHGGARPETKPFDRTWWGPTRVRHERDLNVNGIGPLVEPSLLIGHGGARPETKPFDRTWWGTTRSNFTHRTWAADGRANMRGFKPRMSFSHFAEWAADGRANVGGFKPMGLYASRMRRIRGGQDWTMRNRRILRERPTGPGGRVFQNRGRWPVGKEDVARRMLSVGDRSWAKEDVVASRESWAGNAGALSPRDTVRFVGKDSNVKDWSAGSVERCSRASWSNEAHIVRTSGSSWTKRQTGENSSVSVQMEKSTSLGHLSMRLDSSEASAWEVIRRVIPVCGCDCLGNREGDGQGAQESPGRNCQVRYRYGERYIVLHKGSKDIKSRKIAVGRKLKFTQHEMIRGRTWTLKMIIVPGHLLRSRFVLVGYCFPANKHELGGIGARPAVVAGAAVAVVFLAGIVLLVLWMKRRRRLRALQSHLEPYIDKERPQESVARRNLATKEGISGVAGPHSSLPDRTHAGIDSVEEVPADIMSEEGTPHGETLTQRDMVIINDERPGRGASMFALPSTGGRPYSLRYA
ncbi:hypothetical protein DFH06DRAFT_1430573 [Mycena polygramma]|nr:hypothetical protein DFH06DRAFT_1430573 [Mycena polygramma]